MRIIKILIILYSFSFIVACHQKSSQILVDDNSPTLITEDLKTTSEPQQTPRNISIQLNQELYSDFWEDPYLYLSEPLPHPVRAIGSDLSSLNNFFSQGGQIYYPHTEHILHAIEWEIDLDKIKLLMNNGLDVNDSINYEDILHGISNIDDEIFAYCLKKTRIFETNHSENFTLSGVSIAGSPHFYYDNISMSEIQKFENEWVDQAVIRSLSFTDYYEYEPEIFKYHPVRVFDNNLKTGWLDGKENDGVGSAIGIVLDRFIQFDEIRVAPGYFDERWFNDNNRIKDLGLILKTREYTTTELTYEFKDSMEIQSIFFDKPLISNSIQFVIGDVYHSQVSNDTAISEISFYLNDKPITLHTSKVNIYIRKISKKKRIEEIREYVSKKIYHRTGLPEIENVSKVKFTENHFKALVKALSLTSPITWDDLNEDNQVDLNEISSLNQSEFVKIWELSQSNKNKNDGNSLSIYDYHSYFVKNIHNQDIISALLKAEIDKDFNIQEFIYYPHSFFQMAFIHKNFPLVKKIYAGEDLNQNIKNDLKPLNYGVLSNDIEFVNWLIEHGADPTLVENTLNIPIHQAASFGNLDIMKQLENKGADINQLNSNNENLLFAAVLNTWSEIAHYGNQRGLDLDELYKTNINNRIEILKYGLEKGLNINQVNDKGENLLIATAKGMNSLPIFQFLIENGCEYKDVAVKVAKEIVNSGNTESVDFVLGWKGIEYPYNELLMISKNQNHESMTVKLREHIAKLGIIEKEIGDLNEILRIAIKNDDLPRVKYCVEQGIDLSTKINGYTPLVAAVNMQKSDIVEYLYQIHGMTEEEYQPIRYFICERQMYIIASTFGWDVNDLCDF